MKLFISLIIAFFIIGCSSSEQMTAGGDQKKSNQYDESFDPNSLNDDDIVIHKFDAGPVSPVKNNTSTSAVTGQPEYREVRGFRVQLIATKSIETATLAEQEAKDLFESLNHKTYLIFDAPFYKLRVGDVTTRDEADKIRDIAKDYGYREAFIVPTKVNISTHNTL